jgi:hypothetical protein
MHGFWLGDSKSASNPLEETVNSKLRIGLVLSQVCNHQMCCPEIRLVCLGFLFSLLPNGLKLVASGWAALLPRWCVRTRPKPFPFIWSRCFFAMVRLPFVLLFYF